MREFARLHGVPYSTWQREFRRGATSPIMRRGNEWIYAEYDANQAAAVNEGEEQHGGENETHDADSHHIQEYEHKIF